MYTFSVYKAMYHMEKKAWQCPAKISTDFLGKDVTLMAAYASLKSQNTPQHRWYILTYATLWYTPIQLKMLAFAPFTENSLHGHFHFCHGEVFPEDMLKSELFWSLFPLSFSPTDMSSGPENSVVFLHRVDIGLLLCVMEFQVLQSSPHIRMTVYHATLSDDSKVTHSMVVSTPGDFPWVPESFYKIMYGRWWKT